MTVVRQVIVPASKLTTSEMLKTIARIFARHLCHLGRRAKQVGQGAGDVGRTMLLSHDVSTSVEVSHS